ncbi:LysR substrate-binding domain-containing protein [Pseudoduganella violaceinigra]|uniref:LysR substrate-binding domain-containing protein n=1 Tax=Pseudoduganella violaceinigra TaxID=246602 RepID=UPI001B7FAAE8|nr:LysR substrate-binding domain-containing protein [Pseudoduganella violaceinigra]
MIRLTLRQLEVFVAIANQNGHVTRAAQTIGMTQAAASMAIADLEQQLDAKLFDRIGKQLVLNETGRILLHRAQEVLDRAGEIQMLAAGGKSVFDIRIGASVTVGNHLLPPVLARFKHRFPNGQIRVLRYNTEQVLARLSDFSIELGFVEGPVEDSNFLTFPWKKDTLTIFAPAGHPLAGKKLAAADLTAAPWVMREPGSGTRTVFERALAANGIVPHIALELEQPAAIRECVKAGLGLGCLSRLELQDAISAGHVVPLKAPFLDLKRNINIVLNRQKYVSEAIGTILQLCTG